MKKYIWTSLILIALVGSGALFGLRQLTYAQMPDLKTAAAFVLDHSALYKIDDVKEYTGGPRCYVFLGKDKLDKQLIVFATKDKVMGMEYQSKGITEEKAKTIALQMGFQKVDSVIPGMVDPNQLSPIKAEGKFLWEIYGTNKNGQKQYSYLDFYKGKELWSYVLNPAK